MGAALLADARNAFTAGMHRADVVGALLMVCAAVLCVMVLHSATIVGAHESAELPA